MLKKVLPLAMLILMAACTQAHEPAPAEAAKCECCCCKDKKDHAATGKKCLKCLKHKAELKTAK